MVNSVHDQRAFSNQAGQDVRIGFEPADSVKFLSYRLLNPRRANRRNLGGASGVDAAQRPLELLVGLTQGGLMADHGLMVNFSRFVAAREDERGDLLVPLALAFGEFRGQLVVKGL